MSPAPLAYAQTNAVSGSSLTGQTNIETALSSGCSLLDNFSLCVLSFIYNVILVFSFWVVGLVANLFDFFLGYTLNSEAYQSDFIEKGWGIIRDIANVAFIFTLLYLAIRHILGMSAQKYIPTLIIVALLLNFSLFFTRVVVDAGNILARAFYQSINIENDEYSAESGYRGISAALVNKINPQRLLSQAIFTQQLTTGDYSTTSGAPVNPGVSSPAYAEKNLEDNVGFYVGVFLLLAFVNFTLAGVFLSVALLMVGRTVGLWFAMIFSPIAFITLAVPGSGGFVKQLSFDTWKDTVLKLSFLAPIFIFFLYLTIMFLTVFFETPIPVENQDTFMRIMAVFIPFMFVITILRISKKTAEDMAGEIGGTVKSLVGKALGAVGGVALGTVAMAGRATAGRLAGAALDSGNYEKRIADAKGLSKWRLMQERAALKKFNESSFDIRNAPKAKGWAGKASGVVGGQLSSGMSNFGGKDLNFGKGSDQNRKKYEDNAEKSRLELAKDLSAVSDDEKKEIENRAKLYKEKIEKNEKELNAVKKEGDDIDKRLKDLNNMSPEVRTAPEEKEIAELEAKKGVVKTKISEKEKLINDINESDEFKGKTMSVNDEKKRRRDEYARTVKEGWIAVNGKSLFNPYGIATGNAKQTADKIRSVKDETKKEKAEKAAREYMEEQQKEKDKEKEEEKDGGGEDKKEEKPKEEEKK